MAIAWMTQNVHTIKKNCSAGVEYKHATLDLVLNKSHGYSGKDIALGAYFKKKYV
jgi:hypothetical protein